MAGRFEVPATVLYRILVWVWPKGTRGAGKLKVPSGFTPPETKLKIINSIVYGIFVRGIWKIPCDAPVPVKSLKYP